jgi:hypothetical protein
MVDITEGGAVEDEPTPAAIAAAAAAAAAKTVVNVVDTSSLLYVLAAATGSALICEAITWWFVYSRSDYERLNVNFKKASKRLEKKKEETAQPNVSGKGGKGKDKKLLQLEKVRAHTPSRGNHSASMAGRVRSLLLYFLALGAF